MCHFPLIQSRESGSVKIDVLKFDDRTVHSETEEYVLESVQELIKALTKNYESLPATLSLAKLLNIVVSVATGSAGHDIKAKKKMTIRLNWICFYACAVH